MYDSHQRVLVREFVVQAQKLWHATYVDWSCDWCDNHVCFSEFAFFTDRNSLTIVPYKNCWCQYTIPGEVASPTEKTTTTVEQFLLPRILARQNATVCHLNMSSEINGSETPSFFGIWPRMNRANSVVPFKEAMQNETTPIILLYAKNP
jgi:hypothetical protein